MNNYAGKVCPFCKSTFTENDEVVICSSCEMPHHKDCWIENQGCTTFGCMGTIKGIDTNIYGNQSGYTQTGYTGGYAQTGYQSGYTQTGYTGGYAQTGYPGSRAGASGNYYQGPQYDSQPYAQPTYDYVDPDGALYIGPKKAFYYMQKFHTMKTQNKSISWNWCAFLFAPYWFIYRKMYGYGSAILAVSYVLSMIDSLFALLVELIAYIIFGMVGNYLYMKQIENLTARGKRMLEPYKSRHVSTYGGGNTAGAVLTFIGIAIMSAIM